MAVGILVIGMLALQLDAGVALAAERQEAPPAEQTTDEQTRNALLALAMGFAIFSSSLAFGIAFGIRRRIDQIAGPIPDEDD
jgi:hypothetical protein